jgi:hypothetical protein
MESTRASFKPKKNIKWLNITTTIQKKLKSDLAYCPTLGIENEWQLDSSPTQYPQKIPAVDMVSIHICGGKVIIRKFLNGSSLVRPTSFTYIDAWL